MIIYWISETAAGIAGLGPVAFWPGERPCRVAEAGRSVISLGIEFIPGAVWKGLLFGIRGKHSVINSWRRICEFDRNAETQQAWTQEFPGCQLTFDPRLEGISSSPQLQAPPDDWCRLSFPMNWAVWNVWSLGPNLDPTWNFMNTRTLWLGSFYLMLILGLVDSY